MEQALQDPEVQRQRSELENLRAGLKELRDPPKTELKFERVRNAILDAEIKQDLKWKRILRVAIPLLALLLLVAVYFRFAPFL